MRTSEGLERFVTFLDAIAAIAITLLVLPLVDLAGSATQSTSLGDLLHDNRARIYSFLLSFLVIARLWRAHHAIFERVVAYDTVIQVASLAWALTIATLPFPTQLIAVYGSDRGAVALYVGLLVASSACLSVLSVHVSRTKALQRAGVSRRELSAAPAVSTTLWFAVALVLAVAFSAINYWALLLLLLSGPTVRLWHRYRGTVESSPSG